MPAKLFIAGMARSYKKQNPPKGGFVLCVKCSVSFRSRK